MKGIALKNNGFKRARKVMLCPKCGSEKGFYSKGTFIQYYDSNLEPSGYDSETEASSVYCCRCHARFKSETLQKTLKKEREG